MRLKEVIKSVLILTSLNLSPVAAETVEDTRAAVEKINIASPECLENGSPSEKCLEQIDKENEKRDKESS